MWLYIFIHFSCKHPQTVVVFSTPCELWFYILNAIHSWHQNRSKLKILLKKYCELMRKILWSQNFVKKLIHFIYWPVGLIWKIFVHRSARCKYVYFFRFLLLTLLPVFNILFFCKDFYLPKTGSLHFFKWWNQWIFALLTSSWRISFNDCWCSLIAYSIRWTRMTLSLDWKWGEVYNV